MIKLGSKVKDIITGLEGVVASRTTHLYGCVHIGVATQQKPKDGKVPENEYFDEQRLEVKGELKGVTPCPYDRSLIPELGNKVKDKLTGFKGIVTGITEHLFDIPIVAISSEELKDGVPISSQGFPYTRVEILEPKKPQASKDSSATSGGPVIRRTRIVR